MDWYIKREVNLIAINNGYVSWDQGIFLSIIYLHDKIKHICAKT